MIAAIDTIMSRSYVHCMYKWFPIHHLDEVLWNVLTSGINGNDGISDTRTVSKMTIPLHDSAKLIIPSSDDGRAFRVRYSRFRGS